MSNGKDTIIHLIAGLIKKTTKPYEPFGGDINAKVDLSNYETKVDLKNVSHVDVSSIALKSNLASLKNEVDTLDVGKLTPVPNDLAKLSNVVKNDVVKKTEYNQLATKICGSDFEDKISKIDKKYQMLVVWLKKKQILIPKLVK